MESDRLGRTKLSPSQFGFMVDFISLNPMLAGGKYSEKCDKHELQEKWDELAVLLNADKTGCRKTTERWRKCWTDMKMQVKNKVAKLHSSRTYVGKLTEVEDKAWKLIYSSRKGDASNTSKSNESIRKSNTKTLEETEYIVLSFDDTSERKSSEMSSNISNENDQASLQVEDVLEKSRSKSISEESLDECNKLSNNLAMNSEESMDSETKHINDERVTANHENGAFNIETNVRRSSNYFARKRLRSVSHKLWKERRQEETSIIQLLKKQNELLEYIAGSIGRVEKAVVTNFSEQSKKNEIKTVHDNIDKIAECFGSVSTSLKKIVQK